VIAVKSAEAAAKDAARNITFPAEVAIADDLRDDIEGRDVIIASLQSSYSLLETAFGASEVKSAFYQGEAERLEDRFRLDISIPKPVVLIGSVLAGVAAAKIIF